MNLIDCAAISDSLKSNIKNFIDSLDDEIVPTFAIVVVGNIYASKVYVRNKEIACKKCGINFVKYEFDDNVSQEELIDFLLKINSDPKINAIIVQLPLPNHINEEKVKESIDPNKDADCFSPINLARLFNMGKQDNLDDFILPCTAYACVDAIRSVCNNLEGKKAVVIGRSALVAKPLAHLLLKEDCTVTITHSKTVGLEKITKDADIIVSAIGKSKFLKKEMFKNNAIIIDVGISRSEDGKVSGDVDAEDIKDMNVFLTPVPGGIGPMTVSYLIRNVCKLFIKQKGIEYEKQYF